MRNRAGRRRDRHLAQPRASATRRDQEWRDLCALAFDTVEQADQATRAKVGAIIEQLADLGDVQQIPPMTMAALACRIIGGLAVAHTAGATHDDQAFDDFVAFCHAAVQVAVAKARLACGWTPPGGAS